MPHRLLITRFRIESLHLTMTHLVPLLADTRYSRYTEPSLSLPLQRWAKGCEEHCAIGLDKDIDVDTQPLLFRA